MIAEDRADHVYRARNSEIKDLIQTDYQFSLDNPSDIVKKIVCDRFDIPEFLLEQVPELPDDDIPF